jgi:hypothetical protein
MWIPIHQQGINMQKLSLNIKDLDFIYLLWVFAYKFRFEKGGIGQKPILNKQRVFDDNCDKHYLHLETLNSLLGNVHDVIESLMFTERIGVQPFTVSVGEDRGKKEWFASYEHDSTNPNQPVQKLADIYQDGPIPEVAVLKCFLTRQLGSQVLVTVNEKGDYIHVESV